MKSGIHLGSALIAALPVLLVLPGGAGPAGAAVPATVNFGDVPLHTTATRSVPITLDAGYAVGSYSTTVNPSFAFDYDSCGPGFTGPGTCNVNESFTPTALGLAGNSLSVFEWPVAGGTC